MDAFAEMLVGVWVYSWIRLTASNITNHGRLMSFELRMCRSCSYYRRLKER